MSTENELERSMMIEGVERHWRAVRRCRKARAISRQGAGGALLRRSVAAVADEIRAWRHHAKRRPGPEHTLVRYLDLLAPELAAHTACQEILDAVIERRELPALSHRIGHRLMNEHRLRRLRRERPQNWARCWARLSRAASWRNLTSGFLKEAAKHDVLDPAWPVRDRVALGAFLIEMVRTYAGLVQVVHLREHGPRPKVRAVVVPTEACLEWLERTDNRMAAARPAHAPMVDRPVPWTTLYDGGYHLPEMRRSLVIAEVEHLDRIEATMAADPDQFGLFLRAVNVAQEVAWGVDREALKAIEELWAAGGGRAGLPLRRPIEPPPFPGTDDPERLLAWRKLARRAHLLRAEQGSQRAATARKLGLARTRTGPLYFPHRADFRGRLYCSPSSLCPQDDDLARGLLRFHTPGGPMGELGVRWLARHGANCWGLDKTSWDERESWVREHHARIVHAARAPAEDRWWEEASEPFQFLAFCLEWDRAHRGDPTAWMSTLPVQVDGSNNGLQVYAMLSRDPASARATNCLPTARPQDVYAAVASRVWDKLDEEAQQLVAGVWGRTAVKRPVMTLPYGSTRHACHRYVALWFDEVARDRWRPGARRVLARVANTLWDTMGDVMPGALRCMAWLRQVAKDMGDRSSPLWWVSPSGFLVRQEYTKTRSGRVKTVLGKTVRFTRYREDVPETVDPRRQANGFPPNFVHSIDAAVLHSVAVRAADAGIYNLRLVHDAYATTPDRIADLARIVREEFVRTFEGDPLNLLHQQLQLQAPPGYEVPPPPPRGDLDITLALEAEYLFS